MIFSIYIINKAGGLVYHQEYGSDPATAAPTSTAPIGHPRLSSNDYLVLAGTFHGIHAISSRINPAPIKSSGVEYLETDTFKLFCFQTLTAGRTDSYSIGVKFLLSADPLHPNCHAILRKIYILYADYVMKNPFHTLEMPIRCELFDAALAALVKRGG